MCRTPVSRCVAVVSDPDDPAGAVAALAALAMTGYGVSSTRRRRRLAQHSAVNADEPMMRNDYAAFVAKLLQPLHDTVGVCWDGAKRDPCYRPGQLNYSRLVLPPPHVGIVAVIGARVTSAQPHRHALACAAWITDAFHVGATVAWRPPSVVLHQTVRVLSNCATDFVSLATVFDGDEAMRFRRRAA